jgi:hypothetical protein
MMRIIAEPPMLDSGLNKTWLEINKDISSPYISGFGLILNQGFWSRGVGGGCIFSTSFFGQLVESVSS